MRILFVSLFLCILVGCGNQDTQINTDVATPVSVEEVTLKPIGRIYHGNRYGERHTFR